MGLSENSVPLNPMVLLIIIPFLNGYFIGNIPNIFRQTHMKNVVNPRMAERCFFSEVHQERRQTSGTAEKVAHDWAHI